MFQAEFRQQGVRHHLIEGLAQAVRGEVAEQADAGVRIQSLTAGGENRFPLLVVAEHFVGRIEFSRELQGQAAGAVGAQLQGADVVEGAAAQGWQNVTGLVVQGQFAVGHGIGGEGGGVGLADRADLEQGVFGDRFGGFFRCHAVVEEVLFAVDGDGHGHSGNAFFLHDRFNSGIHHRLDWVLCDALACGQQSQASRERFQAIHVDVVRCRFRCAPF
ncbi:hypothetical protein D3C85_1292570 [compost metagenome]